MKPWTKWLISGGIFLALSGVLALVFRDRLMSSFLRSQYLKTSTEPEARKHLAEFLEDRSVLMKYRVFDPSAGKRDASKYLSQQLRSSKLKLPPEVERTLKGPDWLSARFDWSSFKPDFAWLKELASYDFWNPDPPFEAKKRFVDLDVPDYTSLQLWAKLRLLNSRERHDEKAALQQVRHVARLIWTNDRLVSAMVTLAILAVEAKFTERYGHAQEGQVPIADVKRAKRYFWAMGVALDPRLSDEIAIAIAGGGPGRCLLAVETTPTYFLARSLLGKEFEPQGRFLERIFAANEGVCRPTIVRRIWSEQGYPGWFRPDENIFAAGAALKTDREPATIDNGRKATLEEVQRNPYLARSIGYVLLAIGAPNAFSQYK
jgi:hypothetical protein